MSLIRDEHSGVEDLDRKGRHHLDAHVTVTDLAELGMTAVNYVCQQPI
jgi:hypothetical protein